MKVQTCPTCGGKGKTLEDGVLVVDCPTCSGTGRVVGAPKGQITLTDGDRVLTFPVIQGKHARARLDNTLSVWHDEDATGIVDYAVLWATVAVVNLIMQSAPQGEEGEDATTNP